MPGPERRLAVAAAVLALLVVVPVIGAEAPPKDAPHRTASRDGPTRLLLGPERSPDGKVIIHARGPIAEGDAVEFEAMARALKATELWLNSPGGSADEGMRIGRAVRALGLTTRVDERSACASACVDAFLGGARRYVAEPGVLGVHSPTLIGGPGWRRRFDEAVRKDGFEAAARTLEGAGMLHAHEHAAYHHEMGVAPEIGAAAYRTPNAELRRLTREELRDWRVVTGEWNPARDGPLTLRERMRLITDESRHRARKELPRAQEAPNTRAPDSAEEAQRQSALVDADDEFDEVMDFIGRAWVFDEDEVDDPAPDPPG